MFLKQFDVVAEENAWTVRETATLAQLAARTSPELCRD